MIRTILRETFALFVDDGWFAAALVLWCACCGLILPYLPLERGLLAPVLFAGCLIILVTSVLSTAARRRR